MTFTNPLSLPIFFHTDSTQVLQDTDIPFKMDDLEVRDLKFYQINVLSPYFDRDDIDSKNRKKEYCRIHANGDIFLCIFNMKEVERLIEDHFIKP